MREAECPETDGSHAWAPRVVGDREVWDRVRCEHCGASPEEER